MSVRLLIIDDDKILSMMTAAKLTKQSFEVEIAHSGEEGLKRIENEQFDLVLLDITMPNMSGIDVLKEIRSKFEKNILPVIMVTSSHEDGNIIYSLAIGANDYVTKPINIDVLYARVMTQLEMRELAFEYAHQSELTAVSAMIVTYRHEINNPLMIALGTLTQMKKKNEFNPKQYEKLERSLNRIKDIVKEIDKVSNNKDIDFDDYSLGTKKIKLPLSK